MQNTDFIRVAECVGGPYDGMNLSGHCLPNSIKVETDTLMLLIGTDEEKAHRKQSHQVNKRGVYLAGNDFIYIDGEPIEMEELYEQQHEGGYQIPESTLAKCDKMDSLDGRTLIYIKLKYYWNAK